MQGWFSKTKPNKPQNPPVRDSAADVIEGLREVRRLLDGLQSYFALETDEDLLDAAIYQREALEARHRYLLRLARDQKLSTQALPVIAEDRERYIN